MLATRTRAVTPNDSITVPGGDGGGVGGVPGTPITPSPLKSWWKLVSMFSSTVLLPETPETGLETPPYVKIKMLNPKNGHEVWEHFQQRAPLDVEFEKNTIRLVFRKEVQVLKFLTF